MVNKIATRIEICAFCTPLHSVGDKKSSAIVLPYTDGWEVHGVTFINFNDPGEAVLSTTTIVGTCAEYCGGFHSKFSGIGHVDVTHLGKFRYDIAYCF